MPTKNHNSELARVVCRPQKYTSYSYGFSLIELSTVLAIFTILTMSSTPLFSDYIGKTNLKNVTLNLKSTLSVARQHAISNTSPVNVCALANEQETLCSTDINFNANWSYGWMIYTDHDDNNQYNKDLDELITVTRNTENIGIVFNQRGRLRFFNDGSARSAGFYVCTKNQKSNSENTIRHIKLLYSGRARVTNSNDEKHQSICLSAIQKST